jgi:hypothetical protein
MDERVDIVSRVAEKFAAGEVPQEARPKTKSSTDMFLDDEDPPCSYWCIFRPCRTNDQTGEGDVKQV